MDDEMGPKAEHPRHTRGWRQALLQQVSLERHLKHVMTGQPKESTVDIIMRRLSPNAPPLTVEDVFGPPPKEAPPGAEMTLSVGASGCVHPDQADGRAAQQDACKQQEEGGDDGKEDSPDMLESEGDGSQDEEGQSGDESDDNDEEEQASADEGFPKTQEGMRGGASSLKGVSGLSRLKEEGTVWVVSGGAMTVKRRDIFIQHLGEAGYRAASTFSPETTVLAVMDPTVTCMQIAKLARVDPCAQKALPALCVECQTNCQDVIERLEQDHVMCDIRNIWTHLSDWARKRAREEGDDDEEEEKARAEQEQTKKGKQKQRFQMERKGYACVEGVKKPDNHNEHLTGWFENLRDAAKLAGDQIRTRSYMQVVDIIRAQPRPVLTEEDADKLGKIKGIGSKTVMRIKYILRHGKLPLPEGPEEMGTAEVLRITAEFQEKIWGVGQATAYRLYKAGYRSMEDLMLRGTKDLTRQQLIGLKHWRDLAKRIPREEVELIEARVRSVVERVLPGASVTTCGSYRRGKKDTGDVDILISPPRRQNRAPLDRLMDIIVALRKDGFLTDDLSLPSDRDKPEKRSKGRPMNEYNNVQGNKGSYMGVCRVSEAHPHRRLDLKLYAADELPFAMLYFTGSQYFNLSMRSWARFQKGLSLNDTGLRKGVWDEKGKLVHTMGSSIQCEDEQAVFRALDLVYKAPWERDCGVVSR